MTKRTWPISGVLPLAFAASCVMTGAVHGRPQSPDARTAAVEKVLEHVSPESNKRTQVFRRAGASAVVYFSGIEIDADGAPNAYHPEDKGIDALVHAGSPGNWWALALDKDANPVVQHRGEYSGFYVSTTWLSREDDGFSESDPEYWLDARSVRYIAVPQSVWAKTGVNKGDLAYVMNLKNGKSSYAIVGDWGTENTLGEGSIALGEALGVNSDPRDGGQEDSVAYVVFPGSATRPAWPRDPKNMQASAERLMKNWGGREAVETLRAEAFAHAQR